MNEGWSGGVEPAGKELSGDRGGVYVRAGGWGARGWRDAGVVFCEEGFVIS